jgi:hypothetical protein
MISALIDAGNFLDPAAAVSVVQRQDAFSGPVEVVSDEGYLLIQQLKGVA